MNFIIRKESVSLKTRSPLWLGTAAPLRRAVPKEARFTCEDLQSDDR